MTREEALQAIKAKMDYYEDDKRLRAAIETLIPELAESEDERIIEEIKFAVMQMPSERQDTKNRCLAWLEKQKEPHYTKRNALFDKRVENCDPATMKRVSDEVDEMLEEEQKPAEWDELQADFRNINEAFEDGKKEVIAHPEKYDLCKPAEWSEEDEKIITRLIGYFESFRIAGVATKWEGLDIQEVITLLKSLRNRPKSSDNWKPSEEQMKALLSCTDRRVLAELYEDLQKRYGTC